MMNDFVLPKRTPEGFLGYEAMFRPVFSVPLVNSNITITYAFTAVPVMVLFEGPSEEIVLFSTLGFRYLPTRSQGHLMSLLSFRHLPTRFRRDLMPP